MAQGLGAVHDCILQLYFQLRRSRSVGGHDIDSSAVHEVCFGSQRTLENTHLYLGC